MDIDEINKEIDKIKWDEFFPSKPESLLKRIFSPRRYLEGIMFLVLFRS